MNKYLFLTFLLLVSSCQKKTSVDVTNSTFDGIISPEKFSAKGDGKTDDIAAFRQSVAYLTDKGGGTLKLAKGKTYRISQTLEISSSNLTFDLNGSTINGSNLTSAPVLKFIGRDKENTINTLNSKQQTLSGLRNIKPGDYIKISNEEQLQKARKYYKKCEFVKVESVRGDKINIEQSILDYNQNIKAESYDFVTNITLINGKILCNKSAKSEGVFFEKSKDCLVKNITIMDASIAGLQFSNSVNALVDDVKVISKSSPNFGLNYGVLFSRSQSCTIKNSYCEVLRTGIDQSLSHYITIENNRTKNCGISPHAGTNITIKNNIIEGGNIYMRSYQSKIIGNQISVKGCETGGIALAELNGKSDIVINDNTIIFEENISCDNKKADFVGVGIYSGEVNLTDIIVQNNKIINARKGIYIFRADNNAGNKNLTITDNEIINCQSAGIMTHRYANQLISGNTISGDGKNTIGIHLWESGGKFDGVTIKENIISNVKVGLIATKNYRNKVIKNNIIKKAIKRENVQN